MLEGTRRLLRELSRQRPIDIAQLHERYVGDIAKGTLDKVDEQIAKHVEDQVEGEVKQIAQIIFPQGTPHHQRVATSHHIVYDEDEESSTDDLRS